MAAIQNILTVDVEECFHRNDFMLSRHQRELLGGKVVEQTERVISLLQSYGQRGTFFVLGEIADGYPHLVRRLVQVGFELGAHSYRHQLVYTQKKEDFHKEVQKAKVRIEEIGGEEIVGFRAPSWSITQESLWALRILADIGFRYDSSILPAKAYLGGIPRSNPQIHMREEAEIIEVPPSIIKIGNFRLPFSGGLYLRVLPYNIVRYGIKKMNKKGFPVVIYLHPWELDPGLPKLRLHWRGRFALYHNIDTVQTKLERLLKEFSFGPVKEVLRDAGPFC